MKTSLAFNYMHWSWLELPFGACYFFPKTTLIIATRSSEHLGFQLSRAQCVRQMQNITQISAL